MIRIWRVEDIHGYGPYTGRIVDDRIERMVKKHNSDLNQWPSTSPLVNPKFLAWMNTVWSEISSSYKNDSYGLFRCCFDSREKLLNWFDADDLEALFDCDYKVVNYDVPNNRIMSDDKQCMFFFPSAKLIEKHSIVDIL